MQGELPDFDAEERLEGEVARLAGENARLEQRYAGMAQALAGLAAGAARGPGAGQVGGTGSAAAASTPGRGQPGGPGAGSEEDIVLEFASPYPSCRPGQGGGGGKAAQSFSEALEEVVQRAIEDIRAAQEGASRGLADRDAEIRLLQESQKLNRIRRTSMA